MSTAQPIHSPPKSFGPIPTSRPSQRGAAPASGATTTSGDSSGEAAAEPVDPHLIQQTKQQIRNLVHEIALLAQSDCSLEDFYEGFLSRVVNALAATGGAIWTIGGEGNLQLQYQINLTKTRLTDDGKWQIRHALLLQKVLAAGEPALVAPQSGTPGGDDAGNPTDSLLVIGPLKIEQQVLGIVEIFQRPGGGPVTHRGYLRFLMQMCDLASDFLKSRRLRHFSDRQQLWEQLEQFIRAVHRSLDPRETVFTIANDGRRLIGCDRVSVALCHGNRCRVEAVSGLDSFDRRAEQIKGLGLLATKITAAGQPLWYTGDAADLPPQIERTLERYVDQSHAKTLLIVPLQKPTEDTDAGVTRAVPPETLGALIVEQFSDRDTDGAFRQRVEIVAQHSADALSNAREHYSLFLLPLWKTLGKSKWLVQAGMIDKTIAVAGLIIALLVAMIVVPADFELSASGTLRPQVRREIFAGVDGVLEDVPVEHAQLVEPGQVLARLRNTDLDVDITAVVGKKTATQQQILSVKRSLLDNPRLTLDEQNRLAGELAQLEETADSLQRQLELYREKEQQLVIKSPQQGQVVTWQVRDQLLRRPVQRGQLLMTVVDPGGEWELELLMPERRMGHVTQAALDRKDELPVTFILATHPGQQFTGHVVEIDRSADVRDDEGNTVLIRVAIKKDQLPDLRDGSKVTARVHCGRRAIGYVWFHDVIETVQAKILFWL